jgi:hypothetical protein
MHDGKWCFAATRSLTSGRNLRESLFKDVGNALGRREVGRGNSCRKRPCLGRSMGHYRGCYWQTRISWVRHWTLRGHLLHACGAPKGENSRSLANYWSRNEPSPSSPSYRFRESRALSFLYGECGDRRDVPHSSCLSGEGKSILRGIRCAFPRPSCLPRSQRPQS